MELGSLLFELLELTERKVLEFWVKISEHVTITPGICQKMLRGHYSLIVQPNSMHRFKL